MAGRPATQPGLAEATHQFPGVDRLSACRDRAWPPIIGQVVVIVVERAAGQSQRTREPVQLTEIRIADEVGEAPSVSRPDRVVDQDGHRGITRPRARAPDVRRSRHHRPARSHQPLRPPGPRSGDPAARRPRPASDLAERPSGAAGDLRAASSYSALTRPGLTFTRTAWPSTSTWCDRRARRPALEALAPHPEGAGLARSARRRSGRPARGRPARDTVCAGRPFFMTIGVTHASWAPASSSAAMVWPSTSPVASSTLASSSTTGWPSTTPPRPRRRARPG